MSGYARIGWGAFGLLVLLAGGLGAYFSARPVGEGEPAPVGGKAFAFRVHASPQPIADLGFEDGEGRKRTLAEFRGKVLLLNVWATWCAPCRDEMPALDRLQQRLGGPGFEVVALSIDSGGASAVKRFYDEIGIRSLAIYVDPAARAAGSLGMVGVPTTLLVDREGREIGRRTGPAQWDGPEAVRMIASYLGAKLRDR